MANKRGSSAGESSLREIALVFLKLGVTGFGGPAAHIAMMDAELVRRRGWLTREEFLDLLSATNFIPGPNSTELAIHIGRQRAGWKGLLVAGVCFILPAALLVLLCAWMYVRYGSLPTAKMILYGVKPVIIAVVAQAIWALARTAVKSRFLAVLGAAAIAMNAAGGNELLVIFLAGVVALLAARRRAPKLLGSFMVTVMVTVMVAMAEAGAVASVVPVTLHRIFWFFLKVGSVLFGSGYVLLAFLRTDLVDNWHWLTEAQLLDAIAVGQLTPGPVLTTATFIGYILGGNSGAVLATVGIFLPSFVFVALTSPLVAKARRSALASAVLDGINVASLAVMAVTGFFLARDAVVDGVTLSLALLAAIALICFKINSTWLVLLGGLVGGLMGGLMGGVGG